MDTTCCIVSGCNGDSLKFESKKDRLLEPHIAQNKLATMVLVRIATSMDELASPSTATGCSSGRFDSLSRLSAIGISLGKKGRMVFVWDASLLLPRLEKYL